MLAGYHWWFLTATSRDSPGGYALKISTYRVFFPVRRAWIAVRYLLTAAAPFFDLHNLKHNFAKVDIILAQVNQRFSGLNNSPRHEVLRNT